MKAFQMFPYTIKNITIWIRVIFIVKKRLHLFICFEAVKT